MNAELKFENWCLIELFGHQRIAGLVTEQVIGGQGFVRVDVPELDLTSLPGPELGKISGFTRFYGAGAIYSITPVSEEICRAAAEAMRVRPVNVYIPQLPARGTELDLDPDELEDALESEMEDFEEDRNEPDESS